MIKTPISLQDLRRRIYVKAKADKSWRFWGLYVHVCKMETLREAYKLAKENDGAPGIDGVRFEAIEAGGVEGFVKQIQDELISGTLDLRVSGGEEYRKTEARRSASCRYRLSATAWSRVRSSSSWSRSLRRTSNRGRMDIDQSGQHMER